VAAFIGLSGTLTISAVSVKAEGSDSIADMVVDRAFMSNARAERTFCVSLVSGVAAADCVTTNSSCPGIARNHG
jgi:hypothetical protein